MTKYAGLSVRVRCESDAPSSIPPLPVSQIRCSRAEEDVKVKELEHRALLAKVNKNTHAETVARKGAEDAFKKIEQNKETAKRKSEAREAAEKTLSETRQVFEAAQLSSLEIQKQNDEAEKGLIAAKAHQEAMTKNLEHAEFAASTKAVRKAQADADAAQVAELTEEKRLTTLVARALQMTDAVTRAIADRDAAIAKRQAKEVALEKAAEKIREAEARLMQADTLVAELEHVVLEIGIAKFASKDVHIAPEEAMSNAEGARRPRRTAALRDIKMIASRGAHELSVVDKWWLFRGWVAEGNHSEDMMWNVRKLFYSADGKELVRCVSCALPAAQAIAAHPASISARSGAS